MTTTRGQNLIGKVLGSCVLERLLGYGGSSAVFLAQQNNSEREVAVKVFLPRSNTDSQTRRDFYRRFLLEAEAASQLHHPHILPIYSYGEQDGLPYIVMPYMPGGTLSEYIAKHGPLSLQEAQWYLEQIASALDYAHEHGCIHCDVKPANILMNDEGHVILSDFGIARVVQTGEATPTVEQSPSSSKESLMGTPDYISPEQALGHSLDGASDIYSLGITLFYLLSKQLPFRADSTIALALLHVHEPPPSLALIRADISPTIDRVIHKALAKQAARRFRTAGEFSLAFTRAVELQERLSPVSSAERPASQAKNSGTVAALVEEEREPMVLASAPIVSVKPLAGAGRAFSLPRLASVIGIVVLVVSITAFTTGFMLSHFVGKPSHTQSATPSAVATSQTNDNVDKLANHSNWPISNAFFFDSRDNQQYHIMNKSQQGAALALYADHEFSDFRLTVTIVEVRKLPAVPDDYYGIVFRSTADQSHCYLFEISTEDGGQYVFSRYYDDGHNARPWETLADGPAPSLYTEQGKSNTITIEAHGTTFNFFINAKPVGVPVSDPSATALPSGEVGLYVEEQGAEVAFSHLYIVPSK